MVNCPILSAHLGMCAFPTPVSSPHHSVHPPLSVPHLSHALLHRSIDACGLPPTPSAPPPMTLVVPHRQVGMVAQHGHILYQENRCIDAKL